MSYLSKILKKFGVGVRKDAQITVHGDASDTGKKAKIILEQFRNYSPSKVNVGLKTMVVLKDVGFLEAKRIARDVPAAKVVNANMPSAV
jgi:predicted mannosyl-3-phosphoglycerate phosphatase (HAD superfamily)